MCVTHDPVLAFLEAPISRLRPAARIDLIHLLAIGKPCARVRATDDDGITQLQQWAARHGLFTLTDDLDPGYVFLAREPEIAFHTRAIDQSVETHTYALGRRFGYPECCCDAIARVGEEAIDRHAALAADWKYSGRYRLIDPVGYREGSALICHVPCSPTCDESLKLAERAWYIIESHIERPAFARWATWRVNSSGHAVAP